MHSLTRIFSQLVQDYMRPARVLVGEATSVEEMIGRMAAAKATSALVTDGDGRLIGIVTEQDVTRRIAFRAGGADPVRGVMSAPVLSIRTQDYLYDAIARMRRYGWRHMPVIDEAGRPVGLIDLNNGLAVAAEPVLREVERISHEGSLDGLREIKAAQVELAENLFKDSVPAPEIQALITSINNDIHRRIIEAHLSAMAEKGWGEPPVPFTLLIMGSGGRGENYLFPDQDNGFILDDYPDSQHTEIDAFYIELAERMTRDLDAVGFPYCNGYVMATNPLWRKTRSQWRAQVGLWGRKRGTIAAQLADIFFDFRSGYGAAEMAEELRDLVTEMTRSSPAFLSALQRESQRAGVALGWFGRLATERHKEEHIGKVNLKHRGTLPLVSNLRLLSLRSGIKATSTRARLDGLYEQNILDKDEWDYLRGAFDHITAMLLRQQISDFKAGAKVGNYVPPDRLSERETDMLVDSLRAIEQFSERVHHEFTGEIF